MASQSLLKVFAGFVELLEAEWGFLMLCEAKGIAGDWGQSVKI